MPERALIIVDMQNDYFRAGKCELQGAESAAKNAGLLLGKFREQRWPVVHVRHEFAPGDAPFFAPDSEGAKVHRSLKEMQGEPVVVKRHINSFQDTSLKSIIDELDVDRLLICGAMSHMCIEAITRTASDLGYYCAIAHDACATMDLVFNSITVPASHVHAVSMATLGIGYAYVTSTADHLSQMI